MRKLFKWFFAIFILVAIALFSCYRFIASSAKPYLYSNAAEIPVNKVGLLLGTSKSLKNGNANPYFINELQLQRSYIRQAK